MTTHRNLKPHYAEPKGKSGPVIVVKKGEVMSEPTTAAGKALRDEQDNIALVAVHPHADYMTACWLCDRIIAIEQEARANADRELTELRRRLAVIVDRVEQQTVNGCGWGCDGLHDIGNQLSKALAASEQ
jgi:hypothetical protein